MYNKTIAELSAGLEAGEFSSVELTQVYLDRINSLDEQLNSFITVTPERALEQAKNADIQRAAGNAGILNGIPLAQKDIFCTKDVKTSCGSKMLDPFISPYNATTINKFNDSGAVMLGLARALVKANGDYEAKLREFQLLRRDPRRVERKKYGQRGARRRFQFSKR